MLEVFAQSPALFMAAALLFGLMVGSFLNVVIHRLPRMLERDWREQCALLAGGAVPEPAPRYDLVVPRSACPACGHAIRWYENIPILSWLALRARCSACGAPIPLRYPLVEAVTGVLFAFAAWHWGFGAQAVAAWVLLAALLALAVIDIDTQLLPDDITLPLLWLGLLVNLTGLFCTLEEAVIGAAAGYLSLWLVYHLFKRLTGKEGMGHGDFKLLAALGAWLGWKLLLPIVLAASLAGAVVGLLLIVARRHDGTRPLPFGPWLALAGAAALFWGGAIVEFWLA